MAGGDGDERLSRDLPDPARMVLAREAPIPVAILTGFLGSGKTTLIRRLLRDPAFAKTAVIVNEFGEVGLDHRLIEAAREDVLLLAGGCLCCAAQGDLVRALRALLDRSTRGELPGFRRVVVETSGLADPRPILMSLMTDPLRLSRFSLTGVTATVDCLLGPATLRRHGEAARQVALADRIFLTKADLADDGQRKAARHAAQELSRSPVAVPVGEGLGRLLFSPPLGALPASLPEKPHRHGAFASASRRVARPLPWPRVDAWLRAVIEDLGPNLLRLKGLLQVEGEDCLVALHAVQHVIHLPERRPAGPNAKPDGVVVIIAENVAASRLNRALLELDA